jgi:hypothetical protein
MLQTKPRMNLNSFNSFSKRNSPQKYAREIFLYILLAALLMNGRPVNAEPFFPLLTKYHADSIRLGLSKNKADTNQVSRFIQLGQFYVYKPGSVKADLDSAFSFYKQAFAISKKLAFGAR